MGTLEYTDQLFIDKIKYLNKIYDEYKLINEPNIEIEEVLKNIQENYNNISINILYKYYISKNNISSCIPLTQCELQDTKDCGEKDNEIIKEYNKLIIQTSINEKINTLYKKLYIKKIIEERNIKYKNYIKQIENYNSILSYKYYRNKYDKTNNKENSLCLLCNGIKSINNETSEIVCNNCGRVENIIGTVFESIQIYNQEGFCNKHTSYERVKHGEKWLNRIQARSNIEIKKSIINAIKKEIINENITDIRKVSYNLIRNCLRKTNNTKYNEHIPLIIRIITGVIPPQLSEKEYSLTLKYFNRVVNIFEQVKPKYKSNCPYHPYFFYKVLEQKCILQEDNKEQIEKKRKILSCIHIQSDSTLKKRDTIWKIICEEIDKFEYEPTDKNKYKISY